MWLAETEIVAQIWRAADSTNQYWIFCHVTKTDQLRSLICPMGIAYPVIGELLGKKNQFRSHD